MEGATGEIFAESVKLFALMTPTAVLSAFLGYARQFSAKTKLLISFKTSLAILVMGLILYIWGGNIFGLFGFTLDAFRIGSGVLLMLTAISLMQDDGEADKRTPEGDISIVPLAIPLSLGPASIGAIMVMGAQAETHSETVAGIISLMIAAVCMFALLSTAELFYKVLRTTGIIVLSRLTGLILAAISAQVIFTGAIGFLR